MRPVAEGGASPRLPSPLTLTPPPCLSLTPHSPSLPLTLTPLPYFPPHTPPPLPLTSTPHTPPPPPSHPSSHPPSHPTPPHNPQPPAGCSASTTRTCWPHRTAPATARPPLTPPLTPPPSPPPSLPPSLPPSPSPPSIPPFPRRTVPATARPNHILQSHAIARRSNQETRVQNAFDDVAGNVWQALRHGNIRAFMKHGWVGVYLSPLN